jgi:hypothetical protein
VHAVTAGTDITMTYWTGLTMTAAFAALVLYRLLAGRRQPETGVPVPGRRAPHGQWPPGRDRLLG